MKIQIKQISSHQSSKVLSLMFMTLPFAFIGVLGYIFVPESQNDMPNFPFLFFAFTPIFYGIFGYLFNRVFFFGYNFISKRFGGVEFVAKEQGGI